MTHSFDTDNPDRLLRCWVVAAMFAHSVFSFNAVAEDSLLFDRPIAAVVSPDNQTVLIASRNQPSITVIDSKTLETRQVTGEWADLVDMVAVPESATLLAVTSKSQSLIAINPKATASEVVVAEVRLNAVPAKVAVSLDGRFACVSMTWDHSLRVVPLAVDGQAIFKDAVSLSLGFQPKELLALPGQQFLVADAFGGQLAVIDAASNAVVARHEIAGHHISGMIRDAVREQIYVSHQRLSRVAQTNRDDIHWGSLMQNGLTAVTETDLLDSSQPFGRRFRFWPLGDTGNGAGDPAGLAVGSDGEIAVAIAGTNQLAVFRKPGKAPIFADVGRMPTVVVAMSPSRLLSVNTFDNTVSIVDTSVGMQVTAVLGTQRELATAVDRGEAAFYSASLSHDGWMSCSSCHVDGHSCDLLADTMGDGHFGSPKRIPSLLNVSLTGPWGWDGSKTSLEQQITQTLNKTMHRDNGSRTSDGSDEAVTEDIVAFLKTMRLPKPAGYGSEINHRAAVTDEAVESGRKVFHNLGCVKCHKPEQSYTSSETYDVSVKDERGQTLFNPPSLEGLRFRKSFFHDARFQTLDKLVDEHPDQASSNSLTQQANENLKAFLMSLTPRHDDH